MMMLLSVPMKEIAVRMMMREPISSIDVPMKEIDIRMMMRTSFPFASVLMEACNIEKPGGSVLGNTPMCG